MSKLARTTRAHLLFIITGEKLHPVHHRRLQHRSAVEFCIEWFGTEHLKFKVHSLITLIQTSLRTRNIHSSNYLTEPSSHVRNSLAQSVLPVNIIYYGPTHHTSSCIHHWTAGEPYPRSKAACLSRFHRSRSYQRDTHRHCNKEEIARYELVKVSPLSSDDPPTGLPCWGLPLDWRERRGKRGVWVPLRYGLRRRRVVRGTVHEASITKRLAEWLVQLIEASGRT